jgi:electron transport complex protein RnfG
VRDHFYLRLIVVLMVISAVASGLLALVNSFTEPKIVAYQALAEAKAYRKVLPQADAFKSIPAGQLVKVRANAATAGIEDVKVGTKAGKLVGWACKAAAHGYSSNIKLLVGIGQDAKLGGVVVLEQNETPGLGTEVTGVEFIGQPALRTANPRAELKVNKDGGQVQAVAGATISSRAVVRDINQAFSFFRSQTGQGKAADRGADAITDATSRKKDGQK